MKENSISINIDGKEIKGFSRFSLDQYMQDHHSFQLVVGHDVIEEIGSHVMEKSKAWIGKDFEVSLESNVFKGIITSVGMSHFHGLHGDLVVKGYSPTILMEAGPHKQSWNNQSLKNIAEDVIGAAGISSVVNPKYASSINFMAQYRETHFEFLKRMAGVYHEWLFYDGQKLNFGKPSSLPEVSVLYGIDLETVDITMQMSPVTFGGFSYQAGRNESMSSASKSAVSGLNDLGHEAFNASKSAFKIAAKSAIYARIGDKSELDSHMENQRAASSAGLNWLSGRGAKMDLRPGVIANLEAAKRDMGVWSSQPYGRYLVMSVKHRVTGDHEYSNSFEAIPADLEVLPSPSFSIPIAEPQVATVLSNDDPDKQGRIQVKMLWQDGGMTSPWIRVMTPDAGSSDLHAKNRGFVFIPEEGDQVMVGFRYNDPSRPYVMGSLYHGVAGKGGKDANVLRTIITKGGHEIELDDSKGQEKITLKDKKGNTVVIDTAADSIFMRANGMIDLNASTINMAASGAIMMNAGGTLEGAAGMNVTFGAGVSTSLISAMDTTIMAGKLMSISGGKTAKMGSGAGASLELEAKGDAKLNSQKKINISSKESTLVGSKKATLKSKKTFVEGASKAIVKGNKVLIS